MKTTKFDSYIQELNTYSRLKNTSDFPKLLLATGKSDFLHTHFSDTYGKQWQKISKLRPHYLEAEELSHDQFSLLFEQGSLFDPPGLYILRQCDKNKDLLKWLLALNGGSKSNFICLQYKKKPLEKNLSGLEKSVIEIHEPAPFEFKKCLHLLAKKYRLKFTTDACDLILDSIGRNLQSLDNELQRLQYLFCDQTAAISAKDLAAYLNVVKEEFAFKLRSYIMEGQPAKAQALLFDLCDRGESSLAILGILSNHIRNSLKVINAKKSGTSPKECASRYGLQFYLVNGYNKYVANHEEAQFLKALKLCNGADWQMKSDRTCESVLLSEIVGTIS